MDYREFEDHVADYVAGMCDESLKQRMDRARAADPALDRLAGLHEEILSALEHTPEVKAPEALKESILEAVQREEMLLAEEKRYFRRQFGFWSVLAAVLSALLGYGLSNISPGTAAGWQGAALSLLNSTMSLPLMPSNVPVLYVAAAAVATLSLWFARESLLPQQYSM